MKTRMILMLIAVGLVLGGVFGFKIFQGMMIKKFMAAGGAPAQTVSTAVAEYQDWQPKLDAVGSLRAVKGADLSSEVAGIVQSISFESGVDVEKDAVLVRLRADDEIAKLRALEATERLAETTYQRDLKQLEVKAVSQALVDNDLAALDSAKAQVAQQQAIVDKKIIRAPFGGQLGIRQVDVGQYISPGTAIVTLQQLDPVYIDFTLPERSLTQAQAGRKVTAVTDAHPGTVFEGEIASVNAKVDEDTRNVQLRAIFKNPEHTLLPGMFAAVAIEAGAPERAITIPQTAITYNPYGNTVYIVDNTDAAKPVVKQTFVTLGATRGDQVAVLSGVAEGDVVVTAGQLKLRNGSPIIVNNELQPSNDPHPQPEDK
ncbi:MAG: efflux RND transporter periplasmic adaptor subunit [Alphaproteobacteria bacterium]|nr:efflux RND transporter periplasmic adaptor subunit [Alphaproteobacteria bacterium]